MTRQTRVDARLSFTRVLVVDDSKRCRDAVCSMLSKHPDLQVVGEASDGLHAVHKAEILQPDLILLDLGLPGINGLEAARRIRRLSPKPKLIFVSQESSTEIVEEAIRSGAQGYLTKTELVSQLLPAIEAVLQGRRFLLGTSVPVDSR
jgi:DNA-binding NarL/FixJ family response regulator